MSDMDEFRIKRPTVFFPQWLVDRAGGLAKVQADWSPVQVLIQKAIPLPVRGEIERGN